MDAADYIAKRLAELGVTHVYELVGGMTTIMLDAISRRGDTQIICMHHEQAAGFAAEGHSRITGLPAVAMATSGPGATNLLTAVGSCFFDSVPALFITGQVNRHELKGDRGVRQLGFQETDIVTMAAPVTKGAWLINDPAELPEILERAFLLAVSGRPGPVLLDIPMDVQRSPVPDFMPPVPQPAKSGECGHFLAQLQLAIAAAQRPLLLVGGGAAQTGCRQACRAFAEKMGIPVVCSLMAVDLLPDGHPLRVGLIGSYGNRWANTALARADLVIVLGSRLDIRQTGADVASFVAGKQIFQIDVDAAELNNRIKSAVSLAMDLNGFCAAAAGVQTTKSIPRDWQESIVTDRQRWPDDRELDMGESINPNSLIKSLSVDPAARSVAAYVSDVGQHQMWAAQSLRFAEGQRFLNSGGMGAMGFGLPAAIGACFAAERRPVLLISGDGSLQINIQEMQTLHRNRMPVKIVVINNCCLGMVRQFQESYFNSRFQSTVVGYSAPSFSKVAAAYEIDSAAISRPEELIPALAALWRDPSAPYLLEVFVPSAANAYPKLAFGKPMSEMEPFSRPLDMEGT